MPGPCPLALAYARVPSRRFVTRAELMARMDLVRASLERALAAVPLAESARVAGLSPCHFQRLFSATYGSSPRQYQDRHRFAWARAQLSTGRPVNEVASQMGYSETSAFTRAFKAATGVSPRRWTRHSQEMST
ncbi:MAG: helix-turn-helix transcriptional regulator [Fimbriimonadaceae bacterium]|nr:helix-turn-helix transcriptional regulator [Fimbriimonadaceae bacterium]